MAPTAKAACVNNEKKKLKGSSSMSGNTYKRQPIYTQFTKAALLPFTL